MLTTSAEYQTKIDSNIRKLYSRIEVNYTDVTLDSVIEGTSTDLNYISYPDQMVNGRVKATHKWFELDGQNKLDGTFHLCPDADASTFNEMGWWSSSIANGTGVVNATAQITYSKRKVSGYLISGDDKLDAYPIDFTAKFYDGVSLIFTDTVTANTSVELTRTFTQINNIDKVVLNVTKWSEPNTVVKITEFTTQVIEIYADDITCGWDVLEEREISNDNSIPSGNISANTANFCLINKDRQFDANNTASRLNGLIKPNSYVQISLGVETATGIEYASMFKGWVTDWDVPEQSVEVNASVQDRLNLLTQTNITTSTVIVDNTFKDWFEVVLNDAGLAATQYNIDSTLDNTNHIVPFGWFDAVQHRQALETLAQGSSSVVYQDRDGIIQVKKLDNFPTTSVKTFTRDDYSDKDNQPIYQNIANRISVTTSPLKKTTGVTVYESGSTDPEDIGASTTETYTIFYSDSPISDHVVSITPSVPNVSIISSSNFAWGSTIDVQNTGGATTFQFKVVGSTYEVSGQKTVTRSDSASIDENGEVAFKYPQNPFLQNKKLAEDIADDLLASFKDPQRDLSMSFDVGGNPTIELGDPVTITDLYTSKIYNIISQQLNFDGGLGMTIKGRV